ncbi:unnamed protein product [Rotaria sp. Silwood1]|nr:unnamed protein product [Rotaria sp. Silwood1]CAF1376301.1 unnamed protein product [Rotaria sp. Silwood1]CAF3558936.1 unnamed protein product [Rotaria sp. Silwood1]
MVDNPDKLCTICLRKFSSLLKSDQLIWKKQIEEQVDRVYREEKHQAKLNLTEQQKRKHHRGESCRIDEELPIQSINNTYDKIIFHNQRLFIEYFLHGYCPLNSILSEHLVNYLVAHDQLNDFTLSLFSSNTTCLKRFIINVKYLSRLQCHILNQHPNIIELDIIFTDSNSNRTINMTNEGFYQHICPSIYSKFDEIYTIYGPFILHHLYSQLQTETRRSSISNNTLLQTESRRNSMSNNSLLSTEPRRNSISNNSLLQSLPNSSDEFSHHKLLNGIFNNLHPLTIERLKILSLSHYKFFAASHSTAARKSSLVDMSPLTKCSTIPSSTMSTPVNFIPTNLRLLLKFTNLTSLNLSSTDIKNPCIDIIIDSLHNIDTFDLSSCRSIKLFNSLLKLSSKLKWLNLYNCCFHMQQNPNIYHILYQLKYLEYLDISNDNTFDNNNNNNNSIIDNENDINKFLRQDNCLPRLKHFDISGQKIISSISLRQFLLNHKNLQFLGLFLTNEKYSPSIFDINDLCYSKYRHYTYDLQHIQTILLTENDLILYEPYLIESLTRYRDRSGFVQKILYYIFFLTRSFHSKQQNLLIELILHIMSIHSNLQNVQMASTACIYNLTRTPITEHIHIKNLSQIVQATMNAMATFPNQQQLQKNCLLTLCSDRILHEPYFNFCLLATLVMHNLLNYTDLAIIQPGVAILSLLTTRLTIDECTKLGSIINLKRLIQLIEQQIDRLQAIQLNQNQQAHNEQNQQTLTDIDITLNHSQQLTSDDTLRFCLSLLWNLTDENGIVCENFIKSMGLQLFQRLLNLFSTDTIVLTKIVGLLSNIAEVSHLKIYLYSIDIIPLMQKYLTEAILDVAFSAVGILAHLLYEQNDNEINLELCQQMRETIVSWQKPHTNMVTYRSFKPFLPLLHCTRLPVVQLWAVWAIHHVCSTDRARYSRIIREEKIYDIMQNLYDDQLLSEYSDPLILQLLKSILHLLKPYHPNCHRRSSAVAS